MLPMRPTHTCAFLAMALTANLLAGCPLEDTIDVLATESPASNAQAGDSAAAAEPSGSAGDSADANAHEVLAQASLTGTWFGTANYEQSHEFATQQASFASSGSRAVEFDFDGSGRPTSLSLGSGFEFDLRDAAIGSEEVVLTELVVGDMTFASNLAVTLVELESDVGTFYARFVWDYSGTDAMEAYSSTTIAEGRVSLRAQRRCGRIRLHVLPAYDDHQRDVISPEQSRLSRIWNADALVVGCGQVASLAPLPACSSRTMHWHAAEQKRLCFTKS